VVRIHWGALIQGPCHERGTDAVRDTANHVPGNQIAELVGTNPCVLPRGFFSGEASKEREPYTRTEAAVLVSHHSIPCDPQPSAPRWAQP
jgi:hypothetical protein